MLNIKEIAKSWWIAQNPTKEQSDLANKRLTICKECDLMQESIVFNFKCGECGCPIGKKIFSPEIGACGEGKWDLVDGKK